jgi:hypothetical protein
MEFSDDQRHALGVALNEATLIGVEVNAERRAASLTFVPLSLPVAGAAPPDDPRVQFILSPVGRVAASLRDGLWNDAEASVERVALEELLNTVLSFKGLPVYGWEFLDRPDDDNFARWSDRLSLDWRSEPAGLSHTLDLFQAGGSRHLDLRIWFDDLRILTPEKPDVSLDDFTAGGVRWWDALYAGDPRTAGHGIQALASDSENE